MWKIWSTCILHRWTCSLMSILSCIGTLRFIALFACIPSITSIFRCLWTPFNDMEKKIQHICILFLSLSLPFYSVFFRFRRVISLTLVHPDILPFELSGLSFTRSYPFIPSFLVFICLSVRLILPLRSSESCSPSYFRSLVPPSIFSYP